MKWSYRFKVYRYYKGENQQEVGSFLYTIPRMVKKSVYSDSDEGIPWSVTKTCTLDNTNRSSAVGLFDYTITEFKKNLSEYIEEVEYTGFVNSFITNSINSISSQRSQANTGYGLKEIIFNKGDYFSGYFSSPNTELYFVNDSGCYFKLNNTLDGGFTFYNSEDEIIGSSFLGAAIGTPAGTSQGSLTGYTALSTICCTDEPGNGAEFNDFLIVGQCTTPTKLTTTPTFKFDFITNLITDKITSEGNYAFNGMNKQNLDSEVLNNFFYLCKTEKIVDNKNTTTIEEELTVTHDNVVEQWIMKIPVMNKNFNNYTETIDSSTLISFDYGISYPVTPGLGLDVKINLTDFDLTENYEASLQEIKEKYKNVNWEDLSIIYAKEKYDNDNNYKLMVDLCGNKYGLEGTVVYTFKASNGSYFTANVKSTSDYTLNIVLYDKDGERLGVSPYNSLHSTTILDSVDQYAFSSFVNNYTTINFLLPIAKYSNKKGGYDPTLNNTSIFNMKYKNNILYFGNAYGNGIISPSPYDIFLLYTKEQTRLSGGSNAFSFWLSQLSKSGGEKTPDNPYEGGGSSSTGGGGGSYDDSSDIINVGGSSQIGGVSEFITTFLPTPTQISQISSYLYSEDLLNILAKFLNNFFTGDIFNYILNLQVIPFKIEPSGNGEINLPWGIEVPVPDIPYTNQYIHHWWSDIMKVEEYYGSALDYNPYTDIKIYLPFCGEYKLDPNDIVNKNVQIHYAVDILTGACSGEILSEGSVRYTFTGNMAFTIPLQNTSFDNLFTSLMSATSMLTMPTATESVSRSTPLLNQSTEQVIRADWLAQNRKGNAINSVMDNVKPTVTRTGNLNANNGWLGPTKPYFIISRPIQDLPENYNKFFGYPSNIYSKLSDLTGYTEVSDIHLEGLTATVEEIKEIEAFLNGGIIL